MCIYIYIYIYKGDDALYKCQGYKKTHLTMTFKINTKVSTLIYFNDIFKRVDCIHHIKSCRSVKSAKEVRDIVFIFCCSGSLLILVPM